MTKLAAETLDTVRGSAVQPAYQIREVRMDQDLSTIMPAWKECNASFQDHTIVCDPEWLLERSKLEKADIRAYLFERDSQILGAVALEFYHHRLACQLGDLTVMKLPLNMVRLLGYTPNIPQDESAHSLFFERLLSLDFDAIYMTCIKADSFFWRYLGNSSFIKRHFYFYSAWGMRPHPLIRMTGTYDEYLRKFSSKSRNNLSRQLRKLREKGEVKLVRVIEESDVDSFVEAAAEISRKTYQFRVLGIGIRHSDQLKEWLRWAARQGWLRSYMLKCGGAPCAFQVSYQYHRTFLGIDVGFDPAWSKLGVGIIQQLLALEDLFKNNKPDTCDFGGYADYKQFLANDAHSDALVWLFRSRPYPFLALNTFRLFSVTSKTGAAILSRLDLKSKVKGLLRKQ
jgi:Acetyltransferase (GNAT) domain